MYIALAFHGLRYPFPVPSTQPGAPDCTLHTPGYWALLWQPSSRMYCNRPGDEYKSSIDHDVISVKAVLNGKRKSKRLIFRLNITLAGVYAIRCSCCFWGKFIPQYAALARRNRVVLAML
ncbi:predicted protein [Histoplasma capsulatum G186AR]|uniref:Uncharacterized protein n=1 Tax=Ajellomyces capsulatus (strain G186AR / H82 / ATCC MYA-2454 / RMSCC 2432) TaxID=447093 RepID=C0NPS7_AJECG|nr:uncharacterized protein HCBG_05157 [Histoplasma capsulatum G186AR]EEH06937.1 predicted protein [Histoplasma capsulatum G186AR]